MMIVASAKKLNLISSFKVKFIKFQIYNEFVFDKFNNTWAGLKLRNHPDQPHPNLQFEIFQA